MKKKYLTKQFVWMSLLLIAGGLSSFLFVNIDHLSKVNEKKGFLYHDSHFHLTNYIQEGISVQDYLKLMGDKVGRSTLFGIPLQQQWSYRVNGNNAPTYYLDTDAPLYYYSFTDAYIAMQYKSLKPEDQNRFDPMITGFNPTDMYAAAHIRRVLQTFPGVFTGIGEFSIHKEFVSSKISGDVASLTDPALDSILSFAEETGLVVLIHNDIDNPFPKAGKTNYLEEVKTLFRRHPKATIIWAHIGLGRVVHPVKNQAALIEEIILDPTLKHVSFDISWDEVAKYFVETPSSLTVSSELLNTYPNRFLFGTDVVAPKSEEQYYSVYNQYEPLWKLLTPNTKELITKGNYERIFDQGRIHVRAWEQKNMVKK
ncbi:amidohydrolase family protein [Cytophaga aurantiaca]|uniref:amidohydrolase family protein n=1 Tax=Cytophaga aurantiaca TaxID=29530 RepID=UPI00037A828B|nr:amidohydrolase family protein [Cytophaga aurantiaca]